MVVVLLHHIMRLPQLTDRPISTLCSPLQGLKIREGTEGSSLQNAEQNPDV